MRPSRTTLIVGATGFIGRHLAKYLAAKGEKVVGTYHRPVRRRQPTKFVQLVHCDVTKRSDLQRVLRQFEPRHIYFLAAQSSVREAWFDPIQTIEVNLMGGVYLLEALRRADLKARVLIFSSGTTYGLSHDAGRILREDASLRPKDPYSVSKMGLDVLAQLYAKIYGLHTVVVRLPNLIGPEQATTFSLSNFAYQIAGIEAGRLPGVIRVGNLKAERDYLDIRDGVRALHLAMRRGRRGEVYNIASGRSRRLGDVLDQLIALSRLEKQDIRIVEKKSIMSKDEILSVKLNPSKFRRLTGWRPCVPFRETLRDILASWRRKWYET